MEPRERITGEASYSPLLDPLMDFDKAPLQIAHNWGSRRDQALYRSILPDDFLLPPFISQSQLPRTHYSVSKEDMVELSNHLPLELRRVSHHGETATTSLCSKAGIQGI